MVIDWCRMIRFGLRFVLPGGGEQRSGDFFVEAPHTRSGLVGGQVRRDAICVNGEHKMRTTPARYAVCLALTATMAIAQTTPTFEVASIKPAAPLDPAKVLAELQAGQMPKAGPHVDRARAEYTYMSLKELIVLAYKVKPYQVTGPDWVATQRFDIVAKLPDGASKDDVPKMLQVLLEERFKLAAHRESKEHPVLALVVAKGGSKLKEPPEASEPIDENAPLKPGEMKIETGQGPVRMTIGKNGSATPYGISQNTKPALVLTRKLSREECGIGT